MKPKKRISVTVEFGTEHDADEWCKEHHTFRDATISAIEKVGSVLTLILEVSSEMALVVYGRIKDSVPWQAQASCFCRPLA